MDTLFYYPQKNIIKDFKNNKDMLFFDNSGFYYFKKKKISIPNEDGFSVSKKIKLLKRRKIKDFIISIREWGPIFSRDFDQLEFHELHLRELIGHLMYTIYILEKYKISNCIMFTASPHHVKSLIFDLALRELKIKTIYLQNSTSLIYNEVDHALPFLSGVNFMDREILKIKISKYNIKKDIIKYHDITKKKYLLTKSKYFKYPHVLLKFYSKNYILSFLKILAYYSYDFLKNRIFRDRNNFFINNNYGILTHLKMLQRQSNGIMKYRSNLTSLDEIKKRSKKYLIVAANYQPEATSYPMAKENYNHTDFILDTVNRVNNLEVIYKEHFDSFNYYLDLIRHTKVGIFRSKEYYSQLLSMGCKFIDESTNITNKWFLKNTLPITIGGSIAIERSLMGYKTIIVGNPWYKNLPGTISLDNFYKIKNKDNLFNPNKKIINDTKKFLINKLSYRAFPNDFGLGAINRDLKNVKQNRNNSLKKIIHYLKNNK